MTEARPPGTQPPPPNWPPPAGWPAQPPPAWMPPGQPFPYVLVPGQPVQYVPPGWPAPPPWAWTPYPPPYPRPAYRRPRKVTTGRPAQDSPYHRLGRTDRYRWWKPLLALPLILVATLIASISVLLPMMLIDEVLDPGAQVPEGSLLANPLLEEAALLLTVAVVLPAVWLGVQLVEGRSIGWVSSVRGRLRWRWLTLTAAPIVPLVVLGFAAFIGVGLLVEPDTGTESAGAVDWPLVVAGLAIVALLVPVQAAAEEYFFRGFLLQWIGGYLRNPLFGVAITSVLFALAHADLQLSRLASLTAFGAVAGLLALHTGGLEAGIVLHTVNNLLAFGLSALAGPPPTGDLTDTEMPWWMAGVDIAMLAAVLVAVLLLARRRRIDRAAPSPDPPTTPLRPVVHPVGVR